MCPLSLRRGQVCAPLRLLFVGDRRTGRGVILASRPAGAPSPKWLLKWGVSRADDRYVRVERLIIEAGENTFTLDLHRRLTVVAGMGHIEREGLTGELIGALSGRRPGVHLEVEDDTGRHLAIFQPEGGRSRIVDIDAAQDVSREFRTSDGRLDLMAHLGVEPRAARRVMRLGVGDLATGSDSDAAVDALAAVDQQRLWSAADRLRIAEDALAFESDAVGSAPEDAELIDRVERRHAAFEAAVARREKMRFWSVYVGGISAIGAVPATLTLGMLGLPLLCIATLTTMVAMFCRFRARRAERAEERALEEAGAQSYLGFQLQRVNGLLADDAHRKRLMQVADERRMAAQAWQGLAGDVPVEWALAHRDQITAAARGQHRGQSSTHDGAHAVTRDVATDFAHALVNRLAEIRSIGRNGESLPLILDDPFAAVDPSLKPLLLELLGTAAGSPQIVYLTEDEDVAAWARVESLTGEIAIVEPSPEHTETPTEGGRKAKHVAA